VEALREFGANTDEAIARCANKEDLYLKLVKRVPGDKGFDKLKDAIASKDLESAFEAAHALKGILANLSLTPLLEPAVEITEKTRAREDADYTPLLDELLDMREELEKICAE
ncbi:MAG: Hpt domain-containing protein, partial [Lachnospiraceae bacterium]|nr:Hpt domain-containing protein [Lachnospiraceae bacterium]